MVGVRLTPEGILKVFGVIPSIRELAMIEPLGPLLMDKQKLHTFGVMGVIYPSITLFSLRLPYVLFNNSRSGESPVAGSRRCSG